MESDTVGLVPGGRHRLETSTRVHNASSLTTNIGHQSQQRDEKDALYSHTRSEGFGKEVRRRILLGTYVLTSG